MITHSTSIQSLESARTFGQAILDQNADTWWFQSVGAWNESDELPNRRATWEQPKGIAGRAEPFEVPNLSRELVERASVQVEIDRVLAELSEQTRRAEEAADARASY